MYLEEETIDDLLRKCIEKIFSGDAYKVASSKGSNLEITGIYLRLKNPLARLSMTYTRGRIFSPLGELLWYLKGSNDLGFIKYYIKDYSDFSDDKKTLYGAYGPRLLNMNNSINQIETIITYLKKKKETRKAVIQLFKAEDLLINTEDLPCTISLQFLVRDNKLHLFGSMRSNDLFKGFIHDIFSFTMIQEIIARELGLEVGNYNHFVSSLHLYEKDIQNAENYLKEGLQSTKISMPIMPPDDLCKNLMIILEYEELIRTKKEYNIDSLTIDSYWKDLLYILEAYSKRRNSDEILKIKTKLTNKYYEKYLEERILSLQV